MVTFSQDFCLDVYFEEEEHHFESDLGPGVLCRIDS